MRSKFLPEQNFLQLKAARQQVCAGLLENEELYCQYLECVAY
jgi:hypothetical protein